MTSSCLDLSLCAGLPAGSPCLGRHGGLWNQGCTPTGERVGFIPPSLTQCPSTHDALGCVPFTEGVCSSWVPDWQGRTVKGSSQAGSTRAQVSRTPAGAPSPGPWLWLPFPASWLFLCSLTFIRSFSFCEKFMNRRRFVVGGGREWKNYSGLSVGFH